MVTYKRQEIDYLGFLESQLRSLRGLDTLAYELIQNADDVKQEDGSPGATSISFDLRQDALIVRNDGVFRDRDFDRLQRIAGGAKRDELGTTGAFGIGFISVYQVTDQPEILSSGRRWIIRPDEPADRRIEEQPARTTATRFDLPWASDPISPIRKALRLEAIDLSKLRQFEDELFAAMQLAALFLRQLDVLTLMRDGALVHRIKRVRGDADRFILEVDGVPDNWLYLKGSFEAEAAALRRAHPLQIEDKRESDVTVAIRERCLNSGRLYAVLPSETSIPLPFHINADFFPSPDRKRILFGQDYQAAWNRAAIEAAAVCVAQNLERIRDLGEPTEFWRFMSRAQQCQQLAQSGEQDRVFTTFWEQLTGGLSNRDVVYTARGAWVPPTDTRLLETEAERDAADLLRDLGIVPVHECLRPYYSLLRRREVGTPLLSMSDVVCALRANGAADGIPMDASVAGLADQQGWIRLWATLSALMETHRLRAVSGDESQEVGRLKQAPIAVDTRGKLSAPDLLFRADEATRQLFDRVRWLADWATVSPIPADLVPAFGVREAIDTFTADRQAEIEVLWRSGDLDLGALYGWFAGHWSAIKGQSALLESLRALPIWPSAGHLRPLSGLYLPSGFTDPLGLTDLLDPQRIAGHLDFVRRLGVAELTFHSYVTESIPRALADPAALPRETRRELVRLLADRLGLLQTSDEVRQTLAVLPLIECTDGAHRPATEVYGANPDVALLGDAKPIAEPWHEASPPIVALYAWLGVADQPRPPDLVRCVRSLVQQPPSPASQKRIQGAFAFLAHHWSSWPTETREQYAALKRLAWLPGEKSPGRWFLPNRLYAVFQRSLFATQADFVDVPVSAQMEMGIQENGLAGFLGIQTAPSPGLVAAHLRVCAASGDEVDREVFAYLQRHVDSSAVASLRGKSCLPIGGGKYISPKQAFWREHPFGRYRYQLGNEWRAYQSLLERLGVREKPDDQDHYDVLLEIARDNAGDTSALDASRLSTVNCCWQALSEALCSGKRSASSLDALGRDRVVPDAREVLVRPDQVLFDDRPHLSRLLGGRLGASLIPLTLDASQAMEAVGVRRLSAVVKARLVQPAEDTPDPAVQERLVHRQELLARVMHGSGHYARHDSVLSLFGKVTCRQARRLTVVYQLNALGERIASDPLAVGVLLIEDMLYVVHEPGGVPWAAVARELAQVIKPEGEIGSLASGLKEALSHSTYSLAQGALDELGYPRLTEAATTDQPEAGAVETMGGTVLDQSLADNNSHSRSRAIERVESSAVKTDGTPALASVAPLQDKTDAIVTGVDALQGVEALRVEAHPMIREAVTLHHQVGTPMPIPQRKPEGLPAVDHRPTSSQQRPSPSSWASSSRLLSYLEPINPGREPGESENMARIAVVSQRGVLFVLEYERRQGRHPEEMAHGNEGYDIHAVGDGDEERYIEVKALGGEWSAANPARLTPPEFEMARRLGPRFWLYVVERVLRSNPVIHMIQNPAGKVDRYCIDVGWQAVAEEAVEAVQAGNADKAAESPLAHGEGIPF